MTDAALGFFGCLGESILVGILISFGVYMYDFEYPFLKGGAGSFYVLLAGLHSIIDVELLR